MVGFHGQRRGRAAATRPKHGQHVASHGHWTLLRRRSRRRTPRLRMSKTQASSTWSWQHAEPASRRAGKAFEVRRGHCMVDGPHGQRRGGAVAIVSPEEAFPRVGFHGQRWGGAIAIASPEEAFPRAAFHGQRRGGAAATRPKHGQRVASHGHFILSRSRALEPRQYFVAGPLPKAPFHRCFIFL